MKARPRVAIEAVPGMGVPMYFGAPRCIRSGQLQRIHFFLRDVLVAVSVETQPGAFYFPH